MHSCQTAAPWRRRCSPAASGLQTLHVLLGRLRCETVRQHLCRCSFPDYGCNETDNRLVLFKMADSLEDMKWSGKPLGKGACDGEAEHAASKDTEDGPCPANEESSSQLIPTHTNQHLMLIFLTNCCHKVDTVYRIEQNRKAHCGHFLCPQWANIYKNQCFLWSVFNWVLRIIMSWPFCN